MKNLRKLIPAFAMLLVSAILVSTSTYAWFSMNTTVTAKGMAVKARAEEGLVISNAAAGTYNQTADSVKTAVAELYPGSTADLATWVHSTSTDPADENTSQAYTAGSAWAANSGTYGNYVIHDFYIRSSSASALTVSSLDVKSVTAKVGGSAATQELSKALRVGIMIDGDETNSTQNVYIYAPVTGYTQTVSVQQTIGAYASTGRVDVTALAGNAESNSTVTSIPARTANGTHVQIFVWFEGEDENCISNNIIASLEQLDVEVVFGYTA